MNLFINGLFLGLTLAIMVGPLMIGIVQASLEKGWKAGFTVGLGIWISDFLFIALCLIGLQSLQTISTFPYFKETLGTVGGIVLIGMGIAFLLSNPKAVIELEERAKPIEIFNRLVHGFLINTINPFTFFFWLTVSISFVAAKGLSWYNAWPFYAGVMIPVICGDILKAFGAHWIRHQIKSKRISQLRIISGLAFIVFGIALITRSFL